MAVCTKFCTFDIFNSIRAIFENESERHDAECHTIKESKLEPANLILSKYSNRLLFGPACFLGLIFNTFPKYVRALTYNNGTDNLGACRGIKRVIFWKTKDQKMKKSSILTSQWQVICIPLRPLTAYLQNLKCVHPLRNPQS